MGYINPNSKIERVEYYKLASGNVLKVTYYLTYGFSSIGLEEQVDDDLWLELLRID